VSDQPILNAVQFESDFSHSAALAVQEVKIWPKPFMPRAITQVLQHVENDGGCQGGDLHTSPEHHCGRMAFDTFGIPRASSIIFDQFTSWPSLPILVNS